MYLLICILVIRNGLATNFAHVECNIVNCPDLREKPFDLANSGKFITTYRYYVLWFIINKHIGICGSPSLVDIGGPPYLLPLVRRDKVYDIKDIHEIVGLKSSLIIGAGAGPWPYIGVNCEVLIRSSIK